MDEARVTRIGVEAGASRMISQRVSSPDSCFALNIVCVCSEMVVPGRGIACSLTPGEPVASHQLRRSVAPAIPLTLNTPVAVCMFDDI